MTMQTLVIAHAAFGHNHFFKTNNLFRQWTDADGILDYLEFAKDYIARNAKTRLRRGRGRAGARFAAHALMLQGVNRYPRKKALDLLGEERRASERRADAERTFNDLWRTLPAKGARAKPTDLMERRKRLGPAGREPAVFPGEERAAAQAVAARAAADRAADLAVFLPPEADQGP